MTPLHTNDWWFFTRQSRMQLNHATSYNVESTRVAYQALISCSVTNQLEWIEATHSLRTFSGLATKWPNNLMIMKGGCVCMIKAKTSIANFALPSAHQLTSGQPWRNFLNFDPKLNLGDKLRRQHARGRKGSYFDKRSPSTGLSLKDRVSS